MSEVTRQDKIKTFIFLLLIIRVIFSLKLLVCQKRMARKGSKGLYLGLGGPKCPLWVQTYITPLDYCPLISTMDDFFPSPPPTLDYKKSIFILSSHHSILLDCVTIVKYTRAVVQSDAKLPSPSLNNAPCHGRRRKNKQGFKYQL